MTTDAQAERGQLNEPEYDVDEEREAEERREQFLQCLYPEGNERRVPKPKLLLELLLERIDG